MIARTRRQREVFDYIATFIERHGYEPSYQQIARHFRVSSKNAIAKHIVALEEQGMLSRRAANGKFSLTLQPETRMTDAVCEIPLIEKLSDEFLEELEAPRIFVPRFLFSNVPPEKMFAFRVPSDSMIDEHICQGDIALVERSVFAHDGECVLALLENKYPTFERFYNFGSEIELRPANPRLGAALLPAAAVTIRGIFRGLIRSNFA
ncbi:MAG: transcriptional repressor LexA [Pyrinomonadaceae bacterium]